MAMTPILGILFIVAMSRCKCESTNGYSHSNVNTASQIGDLLKPPPLPPLSPLVPVPFHGGTGRIQRQNLDIGYQYSPPSPSPPLTPPAEFKFPAPFYKQYNFNFVPPPHPFTTTPSPSIFQKVSGWLFPSKEVSYDGSLGGINSISPLKKDCNPCNLVPWIPVLRYKVGSENEQQSISPTYGPPSPTAYTSTSLQNNGHYRPQYLSPNSNDQRHQSFSSGIPHEVYGPPKQSNTPTNSFSSLSSTYGPPSPTFTLPILQDNPLSSTLTLTSNSHSLPSTSYGTPSMSIGPPSSSYGLPVLYNTISSSTSRTPTATYESHPYDNNRFLSTTYSPISPNYYPEVLNKDLPSQSNVEIMDDLKPAIELELPKVTSPTGFKNSYGEIITDTYSLDIPYAVSATAAESNKVKTEVLPYDNTKLINPNISVALANPAPFTLNRGRNIHTLQPVALPNLSVSPLPPIFNARPFRPISYISSSNTYENRNIIQLPVNNVKVEKSIPISEFTHSIEYPTNIIQSPIIDIDISKPSNETKAYRNIPNSFVIDALRDISSQASEDHISAAKSQSDSSFETTGADFGNDLYETNLPTGLNIKSSFPPNHKPDFADLRGVKDEDVDKYRTESNLQSIDSPLLYLKPSAPHKDYENFVTISTPGIGNEYEMYDDIPTTTSSPHQSTFTSAWDESKTYFSDLSPPREVQDQGNHGKLIQIIVPYTTEQKSDVDTWPKNWKLNSEKDFLARKVQSNTENYGFTASTTTENHGIETTTDNPQTVTEYIDADRQNTPVIVSDLYDVKEPPFDIIKLQHTIDDWTEQEYSNSKYIRAPQRTRSSEKYAKQIPDDYFTTTMNPLTSYVTSTNTYNYDFYDHEGSSSILHTITDNKNGSLAKFFKEYNYIERTKSNHNSGKNENPDGIQKLHIYTAASSFRTSTTTPAPWSEVQTSISPLTKEKVYVVTSKPWREKQKAPEYDYDAGFESKKTESDSTASESDDLPFKSPRFSDRPYGFQTTGAQNHLNLDESLTSKEWHHSINDLRSHIPIEHLSLFEGSDQKDNISLEQDTAIPKTAT